MALTRYTLSHVQSCPSGSSRADSRVQCLPLKPIYLILQFVGKRNDQEGRTRSRRARSVGSSRSCHPPLPDPPTLLSATSSFSSTNSIVLFMADFSLTNYKLMGQIALFLGQSGQSWALLVFVNLREHFKEMMRWRRELTMSSNLMLNVRKM